MTTASRMTIAAALTWPCLASAAPVREFVDTFFIGGGVILLVAGVIMVVWPRLFRWGVIAMCCADALFLTRILGQRDVQSWLDQAGYTQVIEDSSRDATRLFTFVFAVTVLVVLLTLRQVSRALFGSAQPRVQPSTNKRAERAVTPGAAESRAAHSSKNNRFRVHDYLEQLEAEQPYDDRK